LLNHFTIPFSRFTYPPPVRVLAAHPVANSII
jgi:hypothetical protein